MRRAKLALALLLGLMATPASGQRPAGDAATRVRAEAEAMLRLCPPARAEDRAWCEMARARFVDDYLRARAGQYQGQRNVAHLLGQNTGGVAFNPVQSCAWRLVIMASGHPETTPGDTANLQQACGRLSEGDRTAARVRADTILRSIAVDPVRNPPRR